MPNSIVFSSEKLQDVANHFVLANPPEDIHRYGDGHINDTFLCEGKTRYILQRLNTRIFTEPLGVMSNIVSVSEAIAREVRKAGGDPLRECMSVIPSKDGHSYYIDEEQNFWRVYLYIGDSLSLNLPRNKEDFRQAAVAFGRFQYYLRAYPAAKLFTCIPHFHDTPKRYQDFLAAVEKDPLGRKKGVLPEISFVEERAKRLGQVQEELAQGLLPTRVTHNDTKLNNVLLDAKTGKALAVIDLDTIMPGSALYDFGDSIRFGANTALEDEKDLSKVSLSLPLFETYVDGYLEGCHSALTAREIEELPIGAYLMTIECGIRFLTDYLLGDTYFRIGYPEHNLVRARDQFALVKDMEKKEKQLQAIVHQKTEGMKR
jgi:Ser/Thr protein kinase RdoA (MazF antagonist)